MKLTNGELTEAREPLKKLLGTKFPVKTAYELAKLSMKIEDELKGVDEIRDGLVKKHGKQEGAKWSITPEDANWEAFVTEMNELMSIETEVVIKRVSLPDCEVEPSVLIPLEKFIGIM